jgi:LPXTG-site transpeptidase (sortase) family protein
MRWTNILARLRRPLTCLASVAAVVGTAMPIGPISIASSAAPDIKRVIATPIPVPVFTPVRLEIDSIKIDAPVVPVGTLEGGQMQSPSTAHDVGWWNGRKVGQGNLLLDGHHDWNGRIGSFYRLPELKPGDEFTVYGKEKDQRATYRVVWVKNYDRKVDARDLLGNKTKQQMATLITCGGTFDTIARTHRERVVARAEFVSA